MAQRAVDTVSNKVALTLNKSAVNNYNSALQNFKASGSKVNSPEYDAAQKAYNKLGANKPANFGDNAYTTQQIDSSIARYETSRAAWNSAGSPTSGSQYDAMMQKWNDIPQASRPSTLGQEAFTSAQKNIIGTPYETARSSWVSAGKPTSGAQYTAMQNEWNNLPAQLTNGASMGDAISPHAVNSLVNNYNNAVGLYYADQTAANKAAAQAAYNALPSSVKPAKLMDTALTTYRADALITDYQNAYVNWWNNGQQVHSAEYTAVENAYQKLGDLVRPPNVGDAVGNFTPTTPGTAGKFSGAITSTLMDESIN